MKTLRNGSAVLLLAVQGMAASAQTVDYGDLRNWMCHPAKATDAARQQPLDLTVQRADLSADTVIAYTHPTSDTGVDIFYVYPTLNLSLIAYNTPMSALDTASLQKVYRQQAGMYAQFGRVFVPYYRQVSLGAYVFASGQGQATLFDTAYRDVERAFRHYLDHHSNGNRFILIGHSQGAGHIQFLLRRLFDNDPALRQRLVVAIAGGMHHVVERGGRTGGVLEHINTCPPLNAGLECGCIMTWRTYKYGSTIPAIPSVSPIQNPYLVNKGMLYRIFDASAHEESYFDLGYDRYKALTRYVTLDPRDTTNYVGWDEMYAARHVEQASPPAKGLMVQNIQLPGDQRPELTSGNDFHNWDLQFAQGDLLRIIPQMIAQCAGTSGMGERGGPSGAARVFPNPGTTNLTLAGLGNHTAALRLLDLQGREVVATLVRENQTIDAGHLPAGTYMLEVRWPDGTRKALRWVKE